MWAEFVEYCAAQVRRAFAGVRALAALVLLVMLIGTADALAAGVAERTREIGAMRAVGLRRRHIVRMVLVEGMVLATLGLVLALAAGFALGTLWVKATFPYLVGWVLDAPRSRMRTWRRSASWRRRLPHRGPRRPRIARHASNQPMALRHE